MEDIASSISERIDPAKSKSKIYVGLEHLDPENIHIREYGKPSDVKGVKLKVSKGDIIFGKRRAYQRKAAIASFDGICSAHAMVLRANPDVIIPELLPFFMHSDAFMNRAIDVSEGSLSPTIKWKILKEQELLIPPLAEQKKLADLLWAGDRVLEGYRELERELGVYLDTTSYGLINTKLTLQQFSIVENEKKDIWDTTTVDEIIREFINGYAFASSGYKDSGIPIITLKNISLRGNFKFTREEVNYWDRDQSLSRYELQGGDVIIAMTDITPDKNLIGRVTQISGNSKYYLNQRVGHLVPDKTKILPEYLRYWGNSPQWRQYAKNHATLGVQANLSTRDIKRAKLKLPSLEEQRSIIAFLSNVSSRISDVEKQINHLEKINKSLINQIFE